MRTTLFYGVMTIGLASAFMYTVCSARSNPLNLTQPPHESPVSKPLAAPAADEPAPVKDTCCRSADKAVGVGATKQQVLAAFGEPAEFSMDSNSWTYDSHVVVFDADGVSGWIKRDPMHLLRQSVAEFAGRFIYDQPAPRSQVDASDLLAKRNWPSVTKPTSKRGRPTGPIFQKPEWLRDWAQKCDENRHRQPHLRYRIRFNHTAR
jgi:hypothetical protein